MKTERPYHIYFLIALGLGLGAMAFTGCSTLRSPYDSDYADDRQECVDESLELFYETKKPDLIGVLRSCDKETSGRKPAEVAKKICYDRLNMYVRESKEIHGMVEGCLRNKGWEPR